MRVISGASQYQRPRTFGLRITLNTLPTFKGEPCADPRVSHSTVNLSFHRRSSMSCKGQHISIRRSYNNGIKVCGYMGNIRNIKSQERSLIMGMSRISQGLPVWYSDQGGVSENIPAVLSLRRPVILCQLCFSRFRLGQQWYDRFQRIYLRPFRDFARQDGG